MGDIESVRRDAYLTSIDMLTKLGEMRELIEEEKSQLRRLRGVWGRREVMFSGTNGLRAMLIRMNWE